MAAVPFNPNAEYAVEFKALDDNGDGTFDTIIVGGKAPKVHKFDNAAAGYDQFLSVFCMLRLVHPDDGAKKKRRFLQVRQKALRIKDDSGTKWDYRAKFLDIPFPAPQSGNVYQYEALVTFDVLFVRDQEDVTRRLQLTRFYRFAYDETGVPIPLYANPVIIIVPTISGLTVHPNDTVNPDTDINFDTSYGDQVSATLDCGGRFPYACIVVPRANPAPPAYYWKITLPSALAGSSCMLCITAINSQTGEFKTTCIPVVIAS